MTLAVNTFNPSINSGIDRAAIGEVAKEVFSNASTKEVDLSTLDLTKFNRPEVGVNLYGDRSDVAVKRQVAQNNNNINLKLNQNTINSIQFLNTQAAQVAHTTHKKVDGKIHIDNQEVKNVDLKEVFALPRATEMANIFNLNKDKRGSNPFNTTNADEQEEVKVDESLSIFA